MRELSTPSVWILVSSKAVGSLGRCSAPQQGSLTARWREITLGHLANSMWELAQARTCWLAGQIAASPCNQYRLRGRSRSTVLLACRNCNCDRHGFNSAYPRPLRLVGGGGATRAPHSTSESSNAFASFRSRV